MKTQPLWYGCAIKNTIISALCVSSGANKRDIITAIKIAVMEKIESARGTMGRGKRRKMADKRSKNMNCKKAVKQNRNPIRLRILPFYTIIFTTAFKSIQIVGWFSQNHRTANPAREPHIIRQRPLFSFPPSHRAPRAVFFFLPSLPTTQRGLCGRERHHIEWRHMTAESTGKSKTTAP